MRMIDIIQKKRYGLKLSEEEIKFFVIEYTNGNIPDYQASALLMSIAINSMDNEETSNLTKWMSMSGEILDLKSIPKIKADKHSTGGVGDKTTLVCAPIVAGCDVPVAKMSGKGLGHTGGTIDKLESIPGFNTNLTTEEFIENVKKIGLAICGQTMSLAPCDKKLYALRDQTATVDSIPLIAASIMSKKLASGADCIVLDVKYGNGAFMKTKEEAEKLALLMCDIGIQNGRKTSYVISEMNQPLGYAIGNSIEVIEAIETLKGKGPADLEQLSVELASLMVSMAREISLEEATKLCIEVLKSGKALTKLKEMIKIQDGNIFSVDDYSLFGTSKYTYEYRSEKDGIIEFIDSLNVGISSCLLGAGRTSKNGNIDHTAGIYLTKKAGDNTKRGDILAYLYTNKEVYTDALDELRDAWQISEK